MPTQTFFNLEKDKQQRVYNALLTEFTEYPLEKVSIKRIVLDAKIPRGSFYQYFTDKDDALRYIIFQEKIDGETELVFDKEIDIYEFIELVFKRESEPLQTATISKRMRLLKQICNSAKAQHIFNEEISASMVKSDLFILCLNRSNIKELSGNEQEASINMLISLLKYAIFTILDKQNSVKEAYSQLKLQLLIIKTGVDSMKCSNHD